jgi:drug/metabolite transporter (DMT)-like permease
MRSSTGRDRNATVGLALGLLSAASFGTSGTFARALTGSGWTPGAAVAVRVGVAAVLLAVPAALALRGRRSTLYRSLPAVAMFGVLGVAAAQVGFFYAVQTLPVGIALLLEYSGVILVVLWMWAVHGERPRRLTVAGGTVAVAGLILVLDLTGDRHLDGVGVFWGLMAAVGLAGYYVLSARTDPQLPSVAMAAGGMGFGAIILLLLGLVGVLPMRAGTADVSFAGHTTSWLVPVVGLFLVAGLVSYLSGIGAARLLGAPLASFLGLTEVVFAVLFAWLALDELPTVLQGVGGVLVVTGVAVVRIDDRRRAEDRSGAAPAPLPVG